MTKATARPVARHGETSRGVPRHGAKCGAQKKQGVGPCQNPAGFKTDHVGFGSCHLHMGNTESGRRAAEVERSVFAPLATPP